MTELIWDGKYTNGRKTAPVRIAISSYMNNEPGDYTVLLKVIDILGNDTTKAMNITINRNAE